MNMRWVGSLMWLVVVFNCFGTAVGQEAATVESELAKRVDAYVDSRFEAESEATKSLIQLGKRFGVESAQEWEAIIRGRRESYPDASEWIGKYTTHEIDCYHVDYSSRFLMYVPEDYDSSKDYALVVVGHGGNSSMDRNRSYRVAQQYIRLYAPEVAKNMDAIVVAPASERGWGPIGYSLVFSTVAKVNRMLPIDPDRLYLTGQSMGGHMTYRMALLFGDTVGAVAPHSGGYDFVAKKSIGNLVNVPGVAVFGSSEPYGINKDNKSNEKWANENGLNWKFVEKNGGHTIYQDELGPMANFFEKHPRDLYRRAVYLRQGGSMHFTSTWKIKGWPEHTVYKEKRPMMWNTRHWVAVQPRVDQSEPLELFAINRGQNRIEIDCNQVRELSVRLHPKMIDFDQPMIIVVNGEQVFNERVQPDVAWMLDTVRESGDRGKVYWTKVDLKIKSDSNVVIRDLVDDRSSGK